MSRPDFRRGLNTIATMVAAIKAVMVAGKIRTPEAA
jgi:hypothetical protein